jgi:hypothetical protein
MKKGIEVEGRYRGMPSFFILNEKDLDLIFKQRLHFLMDFQNVRHINVYDEDGEFIYDSRLVELSQYYTITLECKWVPSDIPEHISHFVLQIDSKPMWNLRKHDSIKFVCYRNVRMICIENMNITNPEELDEDIEL